MFPHAVLFISSETKCSSEAGLYFLLFCILWLSEVVTNISLCRLPLRESGFGRTDPFKQMHYRRKKAFWSVHMHLWELLKARIPWRMSLFCTITLVSITAVKNGLLGNTPVVEWLGFRYQSCSSYCAAVTLVCLTLISYQAVQIYNIHDGGKWLCLFIVIVCSFPTDGALTSFSCPAGLWQKDTQTLYLKQISR